MKKEITKDKIGFYGMGILIVFFIGFYLITSSVLDRMKPTEEIKDDSAIADSDGNYLEEINIVTNLYKDVKILYDVVNSKFKVDQNDFVEIDDIVYKRITNFDEVVNGLFTENGLSKYISDLGSYFYLIDDKYYLAGNLVSYQTYYFRGDNTNIYILDTNENEIYAIIYEQWTINNKNTLATIRVVLEDNKWLIDNVSILASE